jgi:hypothetical protein
MTVYSLFQQPLHLAVCLSVHVFGTPSETGMVEVEEDWFVCLACQALHFQAIYSSRSALRVHTGKSKNPKCLQEWSKLNVIVSPGYVIARGASGMGPCPAAQHQPQGEEYIYTEYTLHILHIYNVYVMYIHYIYLYYQMYVIVKAQGTIQNNLDGQEWRKFS